MSKVAPCDRARSTECCWGPLRQRCFVAQSRSAIATADCDFAFAVVSIMTSPRGRIRSVVLTSVAMPANRPRCRMPAAQRRVLATPLEPSAGNTSDCREGIALSRQLLCQSSPRMAMIRRPRICILDTMHPSGHECGVDGSQDPRIPALSAAEGPISGAVLGCPSVEDATTRLLQETAKTRSAVRAFRGAVWSRDRVDLAHLVQLAV
jgi:hypothetical protein